MKTEKGPRAARSLTATLAIAFLALSVVVLLISGGLQIFSNIQTQQATIANRQQLTAQGASRTVSSFIQEKFSVLETTVRLASSAAASPEEQKQILESLLGPQPAFRQLVLLNAQDQELVKASRLAQTASGRLTDQLKSDVRAQIRQGKRYISPIYIDSLTSEPLVMMAVPATNVLKEFQGTLVAEVNLKVDLWDLVDQLKVGETGRAYVVDRQGNLIAFHDTARVLRGENVGQLKTVSDFIHNSAPVGTPGVSTYQGINGDTVVGTYVPLGTPDWAVVTEVPWAEAYQDVIQNAAVSAVVIVVMAILAGLVGAYLARRLAVPLVNLTGTATRIAGGEMGLQAAVGGTSEVASLATAFNSMTQQLRSFIGGLEQRVEERTAELSKASESLSHRVNQLQAGTEVSRAATTLTNPEQLVPQVVELVQQRFEFYYVGLFLVAADNRYAVLQYGTGTGSAHEAGRVMKERGHRLEIGGESMVGWVCANKQARIALDVGQDAVRFANPLLPDTRSEMALPLRAGERVIGALDVQSAQMAAFDESDSAVLQGMADQVAVALENARLFQQTQAALKEIEATSRLLVREGWQSYLEQKTTRRAEFLAASGPVPAPLQGKEAPQTEPLTIPLELRGQSLGRLTLRREGSRAWSEDETQLIQTIALQTMLAAENARLIEETQRTLGETRALYESSREITSAGEMAEVLTAVLNNLAHTGVHTAAVALFDAPTREQAKNIELAGTWDYTGTPRLAPGVRFEIASFPLFGRVTSEKALVSQDLLSDPEIDEMAKAVLGGLGLRAMAITPLVARGQWMGVLFALMETAHTFTPSELNFHRALADQAAVAIDSRRLLAETQRRAEREALIRQITTRIRAAGDIQGVLETTANELARSMGVSRSIVRLTMGDGT
jgi:GAF domain-containing protein/HAMP domain-containing protein